VSEAAGGTQVPPSALLVRLLDPAHFKVLNPEGKKIEPAHLKSGSDPSFYIDSEIEGGPQRIRQLKTRWYAHHVIRVRARDLLGVAAEFRLERTPSEGTIPEIAHAHVSLRGMTRSNRPRLLALLETCIAGEPGPP
jgi:hypothetical protein